jgi:hypothetical protein
MPTASKKASLRSTARAALQTFGSAATSAGNTRRTERTSIAQLYSVALENPPLLVVSDTKRFRIFTNWTNTVQEKHEFELEDLLHSGTRDLLRNVFRHPERLQPQKTREQVTKDAAKEFVTIAERLRMAGHAPDKVAHFLNRIVFCLFAEDVDLLQDDLFKRLLDTLAKRRDEVPQRSKRMLSDLFANMREGGEYGLEHILNFNGGLFDDDEALPLERRPPGGMKRGTLWHRRRRGRHRLGAVEPVD